MSTPIQNQDPRFVDTDASLDELAHLEDRELAELKQQGYDYCYLNLLTLFGDRLPLERIRALAAACTRMRLSQGSDFYTFLSNLPELIDRLPGNNGAFETLPVKLRGWNFELLQSILGRGRGLILCSHHFGLYRYIFVEMALLGFKMWSFIDKASYDQSIGAITAVNRSLTARPENVTRVEAAPAQTDFPMNLLCVDDPNFARKTAKALRRGEIVLVFIDGNTGWDGPWGNKSKTVIDFLNLPIAVKNGVARLAATLNAPLLSILTPRQTDNSGDVVFGEPIIPPAHLSRADREDFVHEAMQALYDHLGQAIQESPEQWESSRSFHRWRVPSPPDPDSNSLEEEQREVTRLLGLGATFNLDEKRIAHLESQDGRVWIDVKRLKIYKHVEKVENILQIMSEQRGINQSWIDRQTAKLNSGDDIVSTLSYLKKLNHIVAS